MTKSELLKDARALQRVLKVDGLYMGKIDGIVGPMTRTAQAAWESRHAESARAFPGLSARTSGNLEGLASRLAHAVRVWMSTKAMPWAKAHGMSVEIIQGLRSASEQNGLSSAVTKAKGLRSYHVHGAAVDVGLFRRGGKEYVTDDKPYRELYAACGVPEGCLWGGNWKNMPDTPHYQLADWGSTSQPLLNYLGI